MLIGSPIVGYIGLCAFIGRLHDIDHSGWWSLPIWLAAILAAVATDPEVLGDLYFPKYLAIPCYAASVAGFLYLGLKRGTQGPNRFGPDLLVKSVPS